MEAKEQIFPGATGKYADEQLVAVLNDGIPTVKEQGKTALVDRPKFQEEVELEDPNEVYEQQEEDPEIYTPDPTDLDAPEDGKNKTLLYIGGALLIGALLFRK